ncbi:unnamed protein product, partial [Closterium sp. NIES-53]
LRDSWSHTVTLLLLSERHLRAEFVDAGELPRWLEQLRQGVDNFALDYDAILTAMYALTIGTEGDCSLCVLPDPDIEAAALGASESALPGTAPIEALHTFTLDSRASRCFFRDSTTLTPLSAPVLVRLADPSGGPVLASSSTVLPCPAVPFGSLSGLHLPSFYTNLVSTAALQDAMVTTTTPGGVHVRSGSTPLLVSPPIAPDSPVAPPPWSPLPATPSWHALPPPCLWSSQVSASSSFPPTTAPLQTLHMDVWGPARGEVVDVLIHWIRTVRLQLRERFREDLLVMSLHSDRGGEFSSDLLREFCRGESILKLFTLPTSPQQNGISERRIGLVMEVARTSMIHAAAPHFLWPFAVQYAVHQLNFGLASPCRRPRRHSVGRGRLAMRRCFGSGALDVTFDESVPFYRLFPYCSAPPPPPPLFLALGPPQVDPLLGTVPAEGAESEGAGSGGAEPGGAEPRGAEPAGAERGGAEPEGEEPGGTESEGAESGGAEPRGTASSGGPADASPRLSPRPEPLSPQQLRQWFAHRTCLRSGAAGAGVSTAGDTGAGGVGVTVGAGGTGGAAGAGPGGARIRGTGAAGTGTVGGAGAGDPAVSRGARAGGTGAGAAGAGGAGGGDTGAVGAGGRGTGNGGAGAGDTRTVGLGAGGAGAGGAVSGGTSVGGTMRPRPYFVPLLQQTGGFTERREPQSRLASPVSAVRTGRRVPRPRPPLVRGTHAMALCPFSVPLRVPLPPPPETSLPAVPDPESDLARAASPTVSRLLATVVTDASFESTAASALVAELVDFAAACCLDYATDLIAESESPSPPSVGGECALGTDVLEDRQEDFECLAAAVPRFASMLLAPEGDPDALDIPTPRSYAEAITGGTSTSDLLPHPEDDYSLGAAASRCLALRRPVYGLRQAPREWHDTLRTTLVAMRFTPSTADPSLNLCTNTSLPPFYVLVYIDDLVFANADTEALTREKSELQKRHTCTDLGPSALWLPVLLATAHSSVYRPLALSSTFGRVPFVIGLHLQPRAMAALELRWLTYLLFDLGEQPRSPPVLYVDNKAMIALCQELRLEHRMKHIALRYFLARHF